MENINPSMINSIITVLIPIFVPLIVAIIKKTLSTIPGVYLPLVATALGVIIEIANNLLGGVGVAGSDVVVGASLGLAGVGVREATKPITNK